MDGSYESVAQAAETLVESLRGSTAALLAADDDGQANSSPPQQHPASPPSSARVDVVEQKEPSTGPEVTEVTAEVTPAGHPLSPVAWESLRPLDASWGGNSSPAPSPGQVEEPVLAFSEDAADTAVSEVQTPRDAPEDNDMTGAASPPAQRVFSERSEPGPMSSDSWHDNAASIPPKSPRTVSYVSLDKGSPDVPKLELLPRSDSNLSSQSVQSAVSTLGKSMRKASERCLTMLVGDDDQVRDKWDNYDDDVEEEVDAVKRGLSMTTARARKRNMRAAARSGKNKVQPVGSTGASMDGSLSTEPSPRETLIDILSEKRSSRMLIWHYCQTFLFSMLVTAVCIPLVALLSMIKWHVDVSDPAFNSSSASGAAAALHEPPASRVRPNHTAMQWMLLLQLIFPLCVYAVLLHACIHRSFRLPWPMVLLVALTLAWAIGVCGLFYALDIAYWFYYIDLFLIVAAYVPCMCMVGWYVEVDENASIKQRLTDVAVTALLETIVAAATLIYCYFIMPLFFTMTSAWIQMLWLCVIHPLYFEVTTGFIVRKVLHRNRQLGRNHILYLLTIVHSMVHVVVLGTSLQASIEPVRILALTVLLYNLSKLTWRSTIIQRDLFVERLIHGWSFNYTLDERAELSRMVSVGIITEIILENASIFIAPFMMFRMYKEPIFMAVVPNTFFENGGTYPVQTLITLIAMLFGFTSAFDLTFYFLNYHTIQHLPLINTWRRIKRSQGWYLVFLIYAFASMGVLFLFLTMMILPRAAYCRSDNYCDCTTLAYKTICQGEYISTLVDYLV